MFGWHWENGWISLISLVSLGIQISSKEINWGVNDFKQNSISPAWSNISINVNSLLIVGNFHFLQILFHLGNFFPPKIVFSLGAIVNPGALPSWKVLEVCSAWFFSVPQYIQGAGMCPKLSQWGFLLGFPQQSDVKTKKTNSSFIPGIKVLP